MRTAKKNSERRNLLIFRPKQQEPLTQTKRRMQNKYDSTGIRSVGSMSIQMQRWDGSNEWANVARLCFIA